MLALRGLVVFPKVIIHFDVAREKSVKALTAAANGSKLIFLAAQSDYTDDVGADKIYTTGVVAEVKQMLKVPGGITRVMAEGLYRAKRVDVISEEPYFICTVKKAPERAPKIDPMEMEALVRAVKDEFMAYSANMPRMPKEYIESILGSDDPKAVFDNIAVSMPLPVPEKQQLLEANGLHNKLSMLLALLSHEAEVMGIEREIQDKVKLQIDESQKEYYLREQMRAISQELGEDESVQDEAYEYMEKINALKLAPEITEKLLKEADRLARTASASQEAYVIRNYLDTCLDLPWNKSTKDKTDLARTKAVLDKDHYGLDKVKDRILETIAVRQLAPDIKGQIICLYGPPGVGKTTLAQIIANKLETPFYTLSAVTSGVKDVRDVIDRAKSNRFFSQASPILFIDEIHRFSKSQQDSLLGAVEQGTVTLIGATTENPSFEVIRPLLSRCQLYVLKSLEKDDLLELLQRAVTTDVQLKERQIELRETTAMLRYSGGDARKLLNILDLVVQSEAGDPVVITDEMVTERLQQNPLAYDKDGEMHYDIISAFIKSIRGSDPDGAIYWLARMVEGGEDPAFIARRLVISASEDIGLANPNALLLANACFDTIMKVGWPEGRIPLAETTIYLATSPKSNSAYMAINDALSLVRQTGNLPVPLHLRNAPTQLMKQLGYGDNYKYAHDYPGNFVRQQFLPDDLKDHRIWQPQDNPAEQKHKERMQALWGKKGND